MMMIKQQKPGVLCRAIQGMAHKCKVWYLTHIYVVFIA